MSKQSITITVKAFKTLKYSKVGHCALWSSWLSCLQLWHKAYPSGGSDRWLILAKAFKETNLVLSISGPFRKGTSSGLAICHYMVLSGQEVVSSIIQSLSVQPL